MRSSKQRSRSKPNRPRTLGNIVNRVFDSSGPEGKVRGTPQQIIEKYQLLARDAQLSNDRVAYENFLQHAEHYTRMLGEAQREAQREAEQRQIHDNQQGGRQPRYGEQDGGYGRSDEGGSAVSDDPRYQDSRDQDNRDQDGRGQDNRSQDNRGQDNRGQDNRGQDNRGQDNRGTESRSNDNRHNDQRGQDRRDPRVTQQGQGAQNAEERRPSDQPRAPRPYRDPRDGDARSGAGRKPVATADRGAGTDPADQAVADQPQAIQPTTQPVAQPITQTGPKSTPRPRSAPQSIADVIAVVEARDNAVADPEPKPAKRKYAPRKPKLEAGPTSGEAAE